MIPYVQSVRLCGAEVIAGIGLDDEALRALAEPALEALERLHYPSPELAAVMRTAEDDSDIATIEEIANAWRRRHRRVAVLGTGGSSLGAAALVALRRAGEDGPEVFVADRLDGVAVDNLLRPELLADTGFVVVSKSGGTAETVSLALLAADHMAQALGEGGAIGEHFLFISEPGDNPLRRLAGELEARVLDHDPDLGGRYGVLSANGLLPAAIAGMDIRAVRAGARAVLRQALDAEDAFEVPAALGAMVQVALKREREVSQSVLMPYASQLEPFAFWYRQLWAESLGKSGQGTTPLNALGPVDQHSQLQLYLDGPIDKLFTVIALDHAGRGPVMNGRLTRLIGVDYLANRSTGDLIAAMQRATVEALAARGRPVRTLTLKVLDETAMGALFMHFMLETLVAAALWGVDPFGQPAVEESKKRARRYLEEGRT